MPKRKESIINKETVTERGSEAATRYCTVSGVVGFLSEHTLHRPVLLSERLSAVSPHCLASLPTGEIAWYGFYVTSQCALAYCAIICIVRGV